MFTPGYQRQVMTIRICNLLEVRAGNKIIVPGCEPTSAFTSPTLAENRECKQTVVDLQAALEAIPGSTIISIRNPGSGRPKGLFFKLPDGPPTPPGCRTCTAIEDHYAKLREIGEELDYTKTIQEIDITRPSGVPTTGFPVPESCNSQLCKVFPFLM